MPELLEAVFEDVPNKSIVLLLEKITSDENMLVKVCFPLVDDTEEDYGLCKKKIDTILHSAEDGAIIFSIKNLKISNIDLGFVVLRIIKYRSMYDLDFSFSADANENMEICAFIEKIQEYMSKLASQYNIRSWFLGMEPASDKSTRYFTQTRLGPL